jgi:hypothetical protein
MTLQSLASDITATKKRLAGDYEYLKRSPSTSHEAQLVWNALQIAAKKEIILMICESNKGSIGRSLWATLTYKGCQPSDWSPFLSALLEHLDDRSKCLIASFLAQDRLPSVHPTVKQRFWVDLIGRMNEARSDAAQQSRVWQAYCSDKYSHFEGSLESDLPHTVYSGYLCARFKNASDESGWGQSATVSPGDKASVVAWLSPQNPTDAYSDHIARWEGRLRPEISVCFSIDEAEGIRSNPRSKNTSFAVWDDSQQIEFTVLAPEKPGTHTVWIEVSENNRKLASLPLDLVVVEQLPELPQG